MNHAHVRHAGVNRAYEGYAGVNRTYEGHAGAGVNHSHSLRSSTLPPHPLPQ